MQEEVYKVETRYRKLSLVSISGSKSKSKKKTRCGRVNWKRRRDDQDKCRRGNLTGSAAAAKTFHLSGPVAQIATIVTFDYPPTITHSSCPVIGS
jgi:hypothetical protein